MILLLRAALGVCVACLVLAVARWGPVYAELPLPVRAGPVLAVLLPLAAAVAVLDAGSKGREAWRLLLASGFAAAMAAGILVGLRPPAGLPAGIEVEGALAGTLAPAAIDVVGADRPFSENGKRTTRWDGELRVPAPGVWRIWASGQGQVSIAVDGIEAIRTGGVRRFSVGADQHLSAGPHRLQVELATKGSASRLRLGWTPPSGTWLPPGAEVISPRYLGGSRPAILWKAIDVLALLCAAFLGLTAFSAPLPGQRRLEAVPAVRPREWIQAAACYGALFVVMSWPLALNPGQGAVSPQPDARLNAWILAWDAHALIYQPTRVFQAPIFHPLPDALAFSENLLLPALLVAPWTLLGGPLLGYNVALFLSAVASGVGVFLLCRRAGADWLGAFVGGALFACGLHEWTKMAHIHAKMTLFLPLVLWALDRYFDRPTWRRAWGFAALFLCQALSSIYLAAITATVLAVALCLASLDKRRRRTLWRLAAALAIAGLPLAAVVQPYLRMRATQGLEFGLADLSTFATTLTSYLATGAPLYVDIMRLHLDRSLVRDLLFPGVVPLVLGVIGLAAAPRRYRLVAILGSLVAIVMSLGPETWFYRFLHEHVVFFRGIRSLGRFAIVPVLSLCVLTGLAVARRPLLAVGALLLGLFEASHVPLGITRWPGPSEAARFLAGRPGAVLYWPPGNDDTRAMMESTAHFRPLLNGSSGVLPRPYDRTLELLNPPLGDDALRFLRAAGVTEVVARSAELPLPLVARFGSEHVYSVPQGDSARAPRVPPARFAATPTPRGFEVDLGTARSVERVAFRLSDEPWVERPLVRVSADGAAWSEALGSASLADATLSLIRNPREGWGEIRLDSKVEARYLELPLALPVAGDVAVE